MNVELRPQTFDSGLLAPSVGELTLSEVPHSVAEFEDAVVRDAMKAKFDFVSIRAPQPLALTRARAVGELISLTGSAGRLHAASAAFVDRFRIRPLVSADWPSIRELLAFAEPTRFSMDTRLSPAAVLAHKLKMLEVYASRSPQHFLVAESSAGATFGFQLSLPTDAGLRLYEIDIRPEVRTGAVALALLGANLRTHLKNIGSDDCQLFTDIYDSNPASLSLFSKLGLVEVERTYFYHLWLS